MGVTVCTTNFNVSKPSILSTECIYVFSISLQMHTNLIKKVTVF
jgi:hypothetical protein